MLTIAIITTSTLLFTLLLHKLTSLYLGSRRDYELRELQLYRQRIKDARRTHANIYKSSYTQLELDRYIHKLISINEHNRGLDRDEDNSHAPTSFHPSLLRPYGSKVVCSNDEEAFSLNEKISTNEEPGALTPG